MSASALTLAPAPVRPQSGRQRNAQAGAAVEEEEVLTVPYRVALTPSAAVLRVQIPPAARLLLPWRRRTRRMRRWYPLSSVRSPPPRHALRSRNPFTANEADQNEHRSLGAFTTAHHRHGEDL